MPGMCFVPGCNTGYIKERKLNKEQGKRNPSLFTAPRDPELLAKWRIAIGRKDINLTPKHRVCEIHFEENCIERTFETVCYDGYLSVIPRGKRKLKPGSVPTIFPNYPEYLLTKNRKKEAPTLRGRPKKLSQASDPLDTKDNLNVEENFYDELMQNIHHIKIPNNWIMKSNASMLLFIKINSDCQCERHVIVKNDLSLKAFIDNKEVRWLSAKKKTEPVSISNILLIVDNLTMCKGLRSWQNCLGYTAAISPNDNDDLCQECRNRDV